MVIYLEFLDGLRNLTVLMSEQARMGTSCISLLSGRRWAETGPWMASSKSGTN